MYPKFTRCAQKQSKKTTTSSKAIVQLVREWPPGYGGVERVAHELGNFWQTPIFSLDAKAIHTSDVDPFPATYRRIYLPRICIGRIAIPIPSHALVKLLCATDRLHVHLPCPSVLCLAIIARLIHPKRQISVHWHAFLQPNNSLGGRLINLYQQIAIIFTRLATHVVTTSPILKTELIRLGCKPEQIIILPCCINAKLESRALAVKKPMKQEKPLQIIFIGRLDSYKRVDWLLESVHQASLQLNDFNAFEVIIAGDGPNYTNLILQSQELALTIHFTGRVSEDEKFLLLESADVLVLPSDRSNEAFGIVQLEAMATGTPSLAFDQARSGMSWVSKSKELNWSCRPGGLPDALIQLKQNSLLHKNLCFQARERYLRLFSREIWESQLSHIFE